MTDFVTVAQTHELAPGERLVAEAQGTWVIVLNIDGAYFAVEDMCSHEEYYLAEGALEGYSLECPKHGACFDVRTGQPMCPPAVSPIKRYAVRIEGDEIQVGKRL